MFLLGNVHDSVIVCFGGPGPRPGDLAPGANLNLTGARSMRSYEKVYRSYENIQVKCDDIYVEGVPKKIAQNKQPKHLSLYIYMYPDKAN